MTTDEWATLIRYRLDCLGRENSHHSFEKLCMAFARRRIASNLLPASGPVSAGGDQGRDFETFTSYIVPCSIGRLYDRMVTGDVISFACTTESAHRLKQKIRDDIQKIISPPADRAGPLPNRIFVFTASEVAVSVRHKLQAWARGRFGIEVDIIDGNGLAEGLASGDMIETVVTYLSIGRELAPVRSLISLFDEVTERVGDVSPNVDVELRSLGPFKEISLKSRDKVSENLSFSPEFRFPDTEDGRVARKSFEEHIRTGAPVVIPTEYVADIGLPEPIRSLFGIDLTKIAGIGLPPLGAGKRFACEITSECEDGRCAKVGGIELVVIRSGTEQALLSNNHQSGIVHFEVVVEWQKRQFTFELKFEEGLNVKQQLEAAEFQALLADGASVSIVDVATGLPLVGGPVPTGTWQKPDDLFGVMLENLLEIQKATKLLFSAPTVCTIEEVRDVLRVAQIVMEGKLQVSSVNFRMNVAGVKAVLNALESGNKETDTLFFVGYEPHSTELFGTTVELGRSLLIAREAFMDPTERAILEAITSNGDPSAVHEITLHVPEHCPAYVHYEAWASESDRLLYFEERVFEIDPLKTA